MRRLALLPCIIAAAARAEEPLVDYVVEDAAAIQSPLARWEGGPGPGAEAFARAGCGGCHGAGMGPDLADVAARLTEGEIRLMIVEPRIVYPETAMPAYYTPGRYGEASEELVGRTRLSALEIEQIVAFLVAAGGARNGAPGGG